MPGSATGTIKIKVGVHHVGASDTHRSTDIPYAASYDVATQTYTVKFSGEWKSTTFPLEYRHTYMNGHGSGFVGNLQQYLEKIIHRDENVRKDSLSIKKQGLSLVICFSEEVRESVLGYMQHKINTGMLNTNLLMMKVEAHGALKRLSPVKGVPMRSDATPPARRKAFEAKDNSSDAESSSSDSSPVKKPPTGTATKHVRLQHRPPTVDENNGKENSQICVIS